METLFEIHPLLQNFLMVMGLFSIFHLIHDWSRDIDRLLGRLVLGAIFGMLACAAMMFTYRYGTGIYIDARNIIIAMSSLFIGLPAAIATTVIASVMRYYLGGAGMVPGILSMVVVALYSLGFRSLMIRQKTPIMFRHLLVFTILLGFISMPPFFILPPDDAKKLIMSVGPVVLLSNIFWSLVLGMLLLQNLRRREMIETLARSERRADEADKAKSLFLAKVSHEIRTPMNSVVGFADLMHKTRMNETQREYMKQIRHASRSLLGIVEDILDFSSIESGKIRLIPASFLILETLENCVSIVRPDATEKNVALELKSDSTVPENIFTDELRLRQIVTNLLHNAVKFTQQGFVQLSVTAENLTESGCILKISVKDTGPGIDQTQHARIFRAFEQGDVPVNAINPGGTGLGLSIVSQLTQLLGGTIHLDSVIGQGTTFTLSIPVRISKPDQIKKINTKPAPASVQKKGNILVVEDIEMNQMVITAQLKQEGYGVTIANHGQQALDILKEKTFDLVLMDIQMPVMNGIEATEKIRTELNLDNATLPIIAVTAHALPEELKACLEAGMDDCMTKPVIAEILYAKLDEWLGHDDYDPFVTMAETAQSREADPNALIDEMQLRQFISFVGEDQAKSIYAEFVIDSQSRIKAMKTGETMTPEIIHTLMSMSGNFGMNRLTSFCNDLLDDLKQHPHDEHALALITLEKHLDDSIKMADGYLT